MRSIIELIKPVADGMGIGHFIRQSYVDLRGLGERAKFAVRGRPDPSTSVFLAGSGRSGSTWLSTIIVAAPGTQEIFEPLQQLWNKEYCDLIGWDLNAADFERIRAYFRTVYLRPECADPEWKDLFCRILTGRVRNYWTDLVRNSYFPDRFVIKEIRANMMLGYIYRQFGSRIVYLIRHPCAVIASRLALCWSADIVDILNQEQLVEDYLRPWLGKIEQEKDLLGAHAVWWAVENMVALKNLEDVPHHSVKFETMVLEPEREAVKLFDWLGWNVEREKVSPLISAASRMSRKDSFGLSSQKRLSSWRRDLSEEQQKRILWWSQELGIPYYTEALLPTDIQLSYPEIV
ncbi:MAG TPA: sulfotransferase [Candidatus Baltobacteraceae bacterium]|nr:sulfotransferase [Candidatus Baltobacteraceae bacterium]